MIGKHCAVLLLMQPRDESEIRESGFVNPL